uniref:hypothetical protein n=1 Tax=Georgenia subflava TaxID=1622177 RepID=UPI0038B930B0
MVSALVAAAASVGDGGAGVDHDGSTGVVAVQGVVSGAGLSGTSSRPLVGSAVAGATPGAPAAGAPAAGAP